MASPLDGARFCESQTLHLPITFYRQNNHISPDDALTRRRAALHGRGDCTGVGREYPPAPTASISWPSTLKATVPIAPTVVWCGIGKRRATMPTAISSVSTGRRCIMRRSSRALKIARAISSSNACVFPESVIPIPMMISLCSSNAGFGKHRRFRRQSFSVPRCSITVPGADVRSGRGYHRRSLDGETPEIIDRTRGRGVNSSNEWRKNWRTLR